VGRKVAVCAGDADRISECRAEYCRGKSGDERARLISSHRTLNVGPRHNWWRAQRVDELCSDGARHGAIGWLGAAEQGDDLRKLGVRGNLVRIGLKPGGDIRDESVELDRRPVVCCLDRRRKLSQDGACCRGDPFSRGEGRRLVAGLVEEAWHDHPVDRVSPQMVSRVARVRMDDRDTARTPDPPPALDGTQTEVEIFAITKVAKAHLRPRRSPNRRAHVVERSVCTSLSRGPRRRSGGTRTGFRRRRLVKPEDVRTEEVAVRAREMPRSHCGEPLVALQLEHQIPDRVLSDEQCVLHHHHDDVARRRLDRLIARAAMVEVLRSDLEHACAYRTRGVDGSVMRSRIRDEELELGDVLLRPDRLEHATQLGAGVPRRNHDGDSSGHARILRVATAVGVAVQSWCVIESTDLRLREAKKLVERRDFFWHQRFELVPGVFTPGRNIVDWLLDIGGVPEDLTGKTVLDVGTSNGGAAFVLERRGAERVVAVDVSDEDKWGFAALHRFLESRVQFVRSDVYGLESAVRGEAFDLVLCWGVLYHVRHPLLALDAVRAVTRPASTSRSRSVRAVTRDRAWIETQVSDVDFGTGLCELATAKFHRKGFLGDGSNWFVPTVRALVDWCASSGLTPTAH
jgi:tRNA (mo5U34)-methyltransferase